jgi:hypothetical protein
MVGIPELWLPIVVAAALVFVTSAILHMALTYHRADYRKLPNEDEVADALRRGSVAAGQYMLPWCANDKERAKPEMQEKFKRGPVGIVTLLPAGGHSMGKYLALWFVFCLIVSLFAAYLTGRVHPAGADYRAVFRFAGTVAFAAYGLGHFADSIWKGQPWSNTLRAMIDGLIFAGVTGGAFGWLWPR